MVSSDFEAGELMWRVLTHDIGDRICTELVPDADELPDFVVATIRPIEKAVQ